MPMDLEVWHLERAGRWTYACRIFRGKNCYYAGQLASSISANGFNFGVSVRRAGKCTMKHTRKFQVVGVVADALNEAGGFPSLQFFAGPAKGSLAPSPLSR